MRHALVTWTDRGGERSPGRRGDEAVPDLGPVLRLCEQPEFRDRYACVYLLASAAALAATRPLCDSLGKRIPRVELRPLEVPDPTDYASLFQALRPVCGELRRVQRSGGWSVDVLLSAGTPQAQTLWVILVQSGMLDARMLQVIPPQFVPVPHPHPVREVRLDIEGFPEIRALRGEVRRLRQAAGVDGRSALHQIVGDSDAIKELRSRILRIGPAPVPVLILGETGTGKELVAAALHATSDVRGGPFVAESCGAFADGVLHSQLFGHEAGAFTGAAGRHRGLFEQAHGGTLFLDEVGELPPRVQATLLRVLQEGVLRRVGGDAEIRVAVRVIAATHRDLKAMVAAGTFRQDLYYRLCGAQIEVPPLRERIADLPLLIEAFLDEARASRRLRISSAALRLLGSHPWPGNVRELRAEVGRWLVFCDEEVGPEDLSPEIRLADSGRADKKIAAASASGIELPEAKAAATSLAAALRTTEESAVRAALAAHENNLMRTARALGIDRNTLKRKLRSYGVYPLVR